MNQIISKSIFGSTLLAAVLATSVLFAADNPPATSALSTEARLGIGVTSLPEVLKSHLPKVITDGRGILISEVVAGSPADQAGLQVHDVLIRYGDQDLYSPEQLVKKVRNDEPGKKVGLQYVREGKLQTTKVTLGEQKTQEPVYSRWPRWLGRFDVPWSPLRPEYWTELQDAQGDGTEWTSFESLTLKKESDGSYLVRIAYKDTSGNSVSKEFQGTRQQIRDAIQSDNDLPESRKNQLMRTLDDRGRGLIDNDEFPRWQTFNRELFSWPNVDF